MHTHSKIKNTTKDTLQTGDILLAQPFRTENDYKRSVVLILDHEKNGSTGIILNKLSNLVVHDALPQLDLYQPIYYGGKQNGNWVTYIHNLPGLPDVRSLGNGIYLGGQPETLEEMILTKVVNSSTVKFCAGYVEWAPGQLENELDENKWWSAHINADELFTMPSEKLWAYKLITTGHLYGIFYDCDDPLLN